MDDAERIRRILNRDRRALHDFYTTYAPRLASFIALKVGRREDAEEILQDTLFAFLEGIRDFQGKSSIKTYLFSICHHKIIDYYRRKKLKLVIFSHMPQLEALVSPLLTPEEELDTTLLKEKIKCVLGRLVPSYRKILTLKYVDDVSVEDIAREMATSFKSAESQLFRARKAFVEAFLSI